MIRTNFMRTPYSEILLTLIGSYPSSKLSIIKYWIMEKGRPECNGLDYFLFAR